MKKKFEKITIDDFVPLGYNGKPKFQKLVSREMWPLLLEKAFAKMRGSYQAIEGGLPLDAMQTITGYEGEHIFAPGNKQFDDTVYDRLLLMRRRYCLMAAGTKGKDDTLVVGRDSVKGSIVGGHAYSILEVKTAKLTTSNVRLLKMRNPWGTFEWKGDWGDESPLWKTHPGVAIEMGREHSGDNGIFYICWEDFVKHFDIIDVIYPDKSMHNMHLTSHEEHQCFGPTMGCLLGCSRFWCMCVGFYNLWFTESSAEVKKRVTEEFNQSSAGKALNRV